ncbi:hypothetical protein KC341_g29 [Hortaea werneckii]|nr:hypothetical protein KC341_g29 [Hortaea werneckii]
MLLITSPVKRHLAVPTECLLPIGIWKRSGNSLCETQHILTSVVESEAPNRDSCNVAMQWRLSTAHGNETGT